MSAEISPKDLKAKLDAGEQITVIDVREDWEVARGMIPSATHIAMNNIPDSLDSIPKDQPVVFVCKSGARSGRVTEWVAAQGYPNVMNMDGGVMRWTQDVDASFPGRY